MKARVVMKVTQKQFDKLVKEYTRTMRLLYQVEAEISRAFFDFDEAFNAILDEVDPNTKEFGFNYTRTADMG